MKKQNFLHFGQIEKSEHYNWFWHKKAWTSTVKQSKRFKCFGLSFVGHFKEITIYDSTFSAFVKFLYTFFDGLERNMKATYCSTERILNFIRTLIN